MKYRVDQTSTGLQVEAVVAAARQDKLIEEFGKCAAGTCSCPSTQYDKLASINVSQGSTVVRVELTVKPGEQLDVEDIKRCLDHTAGEIER